ncbi:chemotaxis protein CheX [Caloramator mitchellensis]|nr:chemotaxis protein CheX [Caloramator mitchellensis]
MINKYIEIFIKSGKEIMLQVAGLQTDVGNCYIKQDIINKNKISILIEILGSISGRSWVTMEDDIAKRIASNMMGGFPVIELDEMAKSAIAELCNMILGNVATEFSNNNINIDITPPKMYLNESHGIDSSKKDYLCIPFYFEDKTNMEINLSFD